MGGVEEAAQIFVRHAKEIKKVDPTAKLFWNDNSVNPRRLTRFLSVAGDYADGVEFHGKWPYGDGEIKVPVTLADWQQQYPIQIVKHGSFSQRAEKIRQVARELGYPNLMVANNEYGLAQFKQNRFIGFNRFHYSLVMIELLQDLFIGRFDMTALWSNVPDDKTGGQDKEKKRLIDTWNGRRLNPVHMGFELLSSAQGKQLANISGGGPGGYGFAAIGDGRIEVFLLNKTHSASAITADLKGIQFIDQIAKVVSLVDTPDHWGKLSEAVATVKGNRVSMTLPPMPYSKIVLRSN